MKDKIEKVYEIAIKFLVEEKQTKPSSLALFKSATDWPTNHDPTQLDRR